LVQIAAHLLHDLDIVQFKAVVKNSRLGSVGPEQEEEAPLGIGGEPVRLVALAAADDATAGTAQIATWVARSIADIFAFFASSASTGVVVMEAVARTASMRVSHTGAASLLSSVFKFILCAERTVPLTDLNSVERSSV
jgi:hypothetical protein